MVWVVMVLPSQTSMPESVSHGVCDCCSSVPKVMNAFLTTPPTIQRWMAWSIDESELRSRNTNVSRFR